MASLAEFRRQHPEYQNISDTVLADKLHEKFYSSMPRADFDQKLGITSNAANTVPRSDTSLMLDNRYVVPQDESPVREFMDHMARPVANVDRWAAGALKHVGIDT